MSGYKSLKFVEQDIRDTKTVLELRPVFHRLEDRVRCHAFLCLLAQYVRWHMMRALKPLLAEEKEYSFELLMEHLETIQRKPWRSRVSSLTSPPIPTNSTAGSLLTWAYLCRSHGAEILVDRKPDCPNTFSD